METKILNEITIVIKGPSGSGKSAAGELIRDLLRTHGLSVTYEDRVDGTPPERGPLAVALCLRAMYEQSTRIKIVEKLRKCK
jgi:ABC-type glutathione transport system ATPase component